jgi:hypothetical protein
VKGDMGGKGVKGLGSTCINNIKTINKKMMNMGKQNKEHQNTTMMMIKMH